MVHLKITSAEQLVTFTQVQIFIRNLIIESCKSGLTPTVHGTHSSRSRMDKEAYLVRTINSEGRTLGDENKSYLLHLHVFRARLPDKLGSLLQSFVLDNIQKEDRRDFIGPPASKKQRILKPRLTLSCSPGVYEFCQILVYTVHFRRVLLSSSFLRQR